MEIKVDLADLFTGEEQYTTLEEAVKQEIIQSLTSTIKSGIEKQINAEVSKVINETLAEALKDQMPVLINDLINAEYVKVDRWGDRDKGTTTFRKELVKAITEQMVYKKTTYAGDRNPFTKAVDEVIVENVRLFQKEFNSLVNKEFTQTAFDYAINELKKKFGFK